MTLDVHLPESAEIKEESPDRERYTLSDRWIVRRDPQFHTPYSAFHIDSGDKYSISGTVFVILKVLENNCLIPGQVADFLHDSGINLQRAEVLNFINELFTTGLLLRSMNPPLLSRSAKPHHASVKAVVPVGSTPFEAEVHFTKACNLRCRHCVYDAGQKIPDQLEVDVWFRIFEQLQDLEIHRVIISGGEPLIYPGAKSLLQYLASKRMRIELLTNGTLIDESLGSQLSHPNMSTTVSLDGADAQTHDLLRGRGCFRRVMKGLHLLSRAGACFHIATTVHRRNIHQMKDLVKMAIELGAKSINFILLDPLGRAKFQDELLLESLEISNISHTAKYLADVYGNSIYVGYLDPSIPNYKDLDNTMRSAKIFCTAGTTRIAVRSDGVVFPCVYAFHDNRFAMGSTRSHTVKDIWLSDSWELFRGHLELHHLSACKSCSLSEVCTLKICRLRAYYSKGDFYGQPPGCPRILLQKKSMAAEGGDNYARKGGNASAVGGNPTD